MSKEAVTAFLKKLTEDEALRRDLVVFAADRGYEFTVDELGESELDQVAGGVFTAATKYLDPKLKSPTIPIIGGSGGEDR